MGVVYLAARKSQTVALKVIKDDLLDDEAEATRFTREISTLEKIKSPNVAQIINSGLDEGTAWFAVEFVNGPNLSDLVKDNGPIEIDKWWQIARGILVGLADIHGFGVIHRDIKPGNVIISDSGPMIIDFGIAHVSDATSVTATGLVAGSPAWFSPEQIEGLDLSTATDIFSAGSLLFFAASGSSPWGGVTTMTKASVFRILTSEPDLDGLNIAQKNLLTMMLDKEPSKRPTARSVLENFDQIMSGEFVQFTTDSSENASSLANKKAGAANTASEKPSNHDNKGFRSDHPTALLNTRARSTSKKTRTVWAAITSFMLAATVALGIIFLNTPSGSATMSVSRSVYIGNSAVGPYTITLSSGTVPAVTLDLGTATEFPDAFAWNTAEPIRVSYSPPFSEDEAYVGTVNPEDLRLSGRSPDRGWFMHVSLDENSTALSFRSGEDRLQDEVFRIQLFRGNEMLAATQCRASTYGKMKEQGSVYENLYFTYFDSVEKARLDLSGDIGLTQSEWANRVASLVEYMLDDQAAADSPLLSGSTVSDFADGVLTAHNSLMDAWLDFRATMVDDLPESVVQKTYNKIPDKVDALEASSNMQSFASDSCAELIR